ncbi:hypothetical protein N9Z55_10430 [Akkermansiaceae bacterium]|nr:hypothetical protein [Akkermansiaceae bacterium]
MRFLVYLTENYGVDYTYKLITRLSHDFKNSKFVIVTYRNEAKAALLKRGALSLVSKIISQEEIGINSNEISNIDLEKEVRRIERIYTRDSIWEYVYQDRTLIYKKKGFLYDEGASLSRKNLLGVIIKRFLTVEELINDFKPSHTIYISEDIGTSISNILWEVCNLGDQVIKIPIISKFGKYFSLTDDIYGSWPNLEREFDKNINSRDYFITDLTTKKYSRFLKSEKLLEVSFLSDFKKHNPFKSFLKKTKTLVSFICKKPSIGGYLTVTRFNFLYDRLRMGSRKFIVSKLFKFDDFETQSRSEKYCYFPLHVEPEFVLLTQSQENLNQIEVIAQISRKLPSNVCLYVKDHPESAGRRKYSYYKKIRSIPNVKLLSCSENGIACIKGSEAVITIT